CGRKVPPPRRWFGCRIGCVWWSRSCRVPFRPEPPDVVAGRSPCSSPGLGVIKSDERDAGQVVQAAILDALSGYALPRSLSVGQRGRAWDYARRTNEAGAWPGLPAGTRLSQDGLLTAFQAAWAAWERERREDAASWRGGASPYGAPSSGVQGGAPSGN